MSSDRGISDHCFDFPNYCYYLVYIVPSHWTEAPREKLTKSYDNARAIFHSRCSF